MRIAAVALVLQAAWCAASASDAAPLSEIFASNVVVQSELDRTTAAFVLENPQTPIVDALPAILDQTLGALLFHPSCCMAHYDCDEFEDSMRMLAANNVPGDVPALSGANQRILLGLALSGAPESVLHILGVKRALAAYMVRIMRQVDYLPRGPKLRIIGSILAASQVWTGKLHDKMAVNHSTLAFLQPYTHWLDWIHIADTRSFQDVWLQVHALRAVHATQELGLSLHWEIDLLQRTYASTGAAPGGPQLAMALLGMRDELFGAVFASNGGAIESPALVRLAQLHSSVIQPVHRLLPGVPYRGVVAMDDYRPFAHAVQVLVSPEAFASVFPEMLSSYVTLLQTHPNMNATHAAVKASLPSIGSSDVVQHFAAIAPGVAAAVGGEVSLVFFCLLIAHGSYWTPMLTRTLTLRSAVRTADLVADLRSYWISDTESNLVDAAFHALSDGRPVVNFAAVFLYVYARHAVAEPLAQGVRRPHWPDGETCISRAAAVLGIGSPSRAAYAAMAMLALTQPVGMREANGLHALHAQLTRLYGPLDATAMAALRGYTEVFGADGGLVVVAHIAAAAPGRMRRTAANSRLRGSDESSDLAGQSDLDLVTLASAQSLHAQRGDSGYSVVYRPLTSLGIEAADRSQLTSRMSFRPTVRHGLDSAIQPTHGQSLAENMAALIVPLTMVLSGMELDEWLSAVCVSEPTKADLALHLGPASLSREQAVAQLAAYLVTAGQAQGSATQRQKRFSFGLL